jgi:hypothetical protein
MVENMKYGMTLLGMGYDSVWEVGRNERFFGVGG